MRTSMPAARTATDYSRGFTVDPSYRDRDFPGLGMLIHQPRGFRVAWCDNAGHEYTSQIMPTAEAADKLMVEILAADRQQLHGTGRELKMTPQRRNLRVVEARE